MDVINDPKAFLIHSYQIAKAHLMLAQVELQMIKQFAEQTLEDVYEFRIPVDDEDEPDYEESFIIPLETLPLSVGAIIQRIEAVQKALDKEDKE